MIDLRYGRDVLEALREIPDDTAQCCVTSPPYFGLRDYGTSTWEGGSPTCDHKGRPFAYKADINRNTNRGDPGKNAADTEPMRGSCSKCGAIRIDKQIGLESTLDEFIAKLVAVFREVRRVLHPSGTCWVNMGDSYGEGKALLNVPYRLALALSADGWTHRDTIIWHKPAPMPESVTDRCTKAWEPIFMFVKSPRYFADMEAVKSPASPNTHGRTVGQKQLLVPKAGGNAANADYASRITGHVSECNLRNVWTMSAEPYAAAHFATYPSELPRRCIRIGTSIKGCCPTCRAPWVRETARRAVKRHRPNDVTKRDGADGTGNHCANSVAGVSVDTLGWRPSCKHPHTEADTLPCLVLDPFSGSGTTGAVAQQLGQDYLGIDLNPAYLPLAQERIGGLFLKGA